MLNQFLDSLLPGARSIRPPLIAGILWTLFLWILLADNIPNRDDAEGWAAQAYDLASAAGPVATAVVVSTLIFVVGALLSGATAEVASAIGSVGREVQRFMRWQAHARRKRRQVKKKLNESERRLNGESELNADQRKSREREKRHAESHLERINKDRILFGLLIRDSNATRQSNSVGPLPADVVVEQAPARELQKAIISRCRLRGIDAAIQDLGVDASVDTIDREVETHVGTYEQLTSDLAREIPDDPLDAMRASDDAQFLELDRERTEREVRLAISPPVVALGLFGVVMWSPWWGIAAAIGALDFYRNSVKRSGERSRILNQMIWKGIETPVMKQAMAEGRDEVRRYLTQIAAEKRDREAMASADEVTDLAAASADR